MKLEFICAETKGSILLENRFETEKGKYQIVIRRYNSNLYFFKYRNGDLLECQNLSTAKPKEVNTNG